ncbi:MAG: hypothetical protein LBC86_10750 [Oscillospiraceae bacterium]|nr:hypothetical protein [Oscillospiraceae bacterium]
MKKGLNKNMKRTIKLIAVFLIIFITISLFPLAASANSAEPPMFTVMVSNAPEDLQLSLRLADGTQYSANVIKNNPANDTFYHFYSDGGLFFIGRTELNEATLVVTTGGETLEFTLLGMQNTYHRLVTLSLSNRTLIPGTPLVRNAVLVVMRIVLTLLIEGLIFFAFGFRSKRNWTIFLVVNLITQGGLNIIFSNPNMGMGGYWGLAYIGLEIIIFLVEIAVFTILLKKEPKETKKHWWKAPTYAIAANTASLFAGAYLISAFMIYY